MEVNVQVAAVVPGVAVGGDTKAHLGLLTMSVEDPGEVPHQVPAGAKSPPAKFPPSVVNLAA